MTSSSTPPGSRPAEDTGTIVLDQPFTERDLPALRRTVAAHAERTPLPANRVNDLVLVVSELVSNAIRHGGGGGRLRLSATADAVHVEVSDEGPGFPRQHHLPRQRPEPTVSGGRGLWLVLTFADELRLHAGARGGAIATAILRVAQP